MESCGSIIMKKKEFEEKIKEYDIEKIPNKGLIKSIIERNYEYYSRKNEVNNIYGIQRKDKEYIVFFKDIERGITNDIGCFSTEDEAYEVLLNTINSWEPEKIK